MARIPPPISEYRTPLLYALEHSSVLVLSGETGCGKSTQLPQYLHAAGYTALGCVVCSQPQRLAAVTLATRVCEEMGVALGSTVGYTVRFDSRQSASTSILYTTDDMLLREFLVDPRLSRFSVIMVDEVHERTVHTDLLLGLLLRLRHARPDDLKIIVASATLDVDRFAAFFSQNLSSTAALESKGGVGGLTVEGSGGGGGESSGGGAKDALKRVQLEEDEDGEEELRKALELALASRRRNGGKGPAAAVVKSKPLELPDAPGAILISREEVEEEEEEGEQEGMSGGNGASVEIVIPRKRVSRWSDKSSGGVVSGAVPPSIPPRPPSKAEVSQAQGGMASGVVGPSPAPPSLPQPSPTTTVLPVAIMAVHGRSNPVDVQYLESPCSNTIEAAVRVVMEILQTRGESGGDILVFLPGKEEVRECEEALSEALGEAAAAVAAAAAAAAAEAVGGGRSGSGSSGVGRGGGSSRPPPPSLPPLDIFPLHPSLPPSAISAALSPPRLTHRRSGGDLTTTLTRRCILATDFAQSALTIPGVRYVIDSGWARLPCFDPTTGLSSVLLTPISRSCAVQRAGRAARCLGGSGSGSSSGGGVGVCFRLYTQHTYTTLLPAHHPPEILRCDPSQPLLTLLALGTGLGGKAGGGGGPVPMPHPHPQTPPRGFPFLDPPRPLSLTRSLEYLHAVGGITVGGALTEPLGSVLARLPLHPTYGALLLKSLTLGCAGEACTLAALTHPDTGRVFHTHAKSGGGAGSAFSVKEGDGLTLVNAFTAFMEQPTQGRGAWAKSQGLDAGALTRGGVLRGHFWAMLSAIVGRMRSRRGVGGGNGTAASANGGGVALAPSPVPPWSLDALPSGSETEGSSSGGGGVPTALRKAICASFCHQAAKLDSSGVYVTVREGYRAALHPSSVVCQVFPPPPWVVYGEAVWEDGVMYLCMVTPISPLWLLEFAPGMYVAKGGLPGAVGGGEIPGHPFSSATTTTLPPMEPPRFKSASERRREGEEAAAAKAKAAADAAAAPSVPPPPPPPPPPGTTGVGSGTQLVSSFLGSFLVEGGGMGVFGGGGGGGNKKPRA